MHDINLSLRWVLESRNTAKKRNATIKIISLFLLASCGMSVGASLSPVKAGEPGDAFDRLYGKRIELFTKHLAIYESVVDEASAAEAAKKWRSLLPLEKEIREECHCRADMSAQIGLGLAGWIF